MSGHVDTIFKMFGCKENCATVEHHLSETDVLISLQRFKHLTNHQQRQWVLDYLHTNTCKEGDDSETFYFIRGKHVCFTVWLSVLGLSKSRFYEIRKIFCGGALVIEQFSSQKSNLPKSEEAISWMRDYFNMIGDHMPDRMAIHLPSFLTSSLIYERMTEDFTANNLDVISRSQFYKLWLREFRHVQIPKENRFTRCDTCTLTKNELIKTVDPCQRKIYKNLLDSHNKLQMQERSYYYDKRGKARQEPNKYLSIIIDGMDQSKTDLPHLKRKNKAFCNMWVLRTHVTGVIVHGRRSFAFVDLHLWPHDSNLSSNILLQVLLQQSNLPSTLYLQLDNCFRENKNQFLFGFLGVLIRQEIFKEIELGFLMVGHTHEDIDQFFSKFSQYLRNNDAHTLPDLLSGIEKCYSDVPDANLIESMFDIKSWLQPTLRKLHNHSYPHIFRFTRNSGGAVVMHYKEWSHTPWLPMGDGIQLFTTYPLGSPEKLIPSLDKLDFRKLSSHARQYRVRCGISEQSQAWWNSFLPHLKEAATWRSEAWPLSRLRHRVECQPTYSRTDSNQNDAVLDIAQLPNHLRIVYQKENSSHNQVYAGPTARIARISGPTVNTATTARNEIPIVCNAASMNGPTASSVGVATQGALPESTLNQTEQQMAWGVGDLVGLACPQYQECPQIALIKAISGSAVSVRWYDGNWTTKWGVYMYKQGRQSVPWDEVVNSQHILQVVKLTNSGKLTAKSKRELHTLYGQQ